ncbi:MAG: ferritin family protein [Desulfomonilaceae bacterium]
MFVFGTAEDVFTMAVRIEENGHAFYSGAAEKATDQETKKLFEQLATMEANHIKAFKSLRSSLPEDALSPEVWDPEGLAESYLQASADTHIFTHETAGSRLKNVNSTQEAITMAIQFEKDSVAFFLGMKEILPDPKGKSEIDQLIKAEMEHVRMLTLTARNLSESDVAGIA